MAGQPPLIGLIGLIGCGKSTVAGMLAARGAVVIDADQVTRELMGPGEPLTQVVFARFGDDLMRPDGSLDRAALGRLVFSDAELLADLEAIVHPAVRARIQQRIASARSGESPFVVLEAIKLVEAGYARICNEIWLVMCDPSVQLARLIARGMDESDARQRAAAQAAALPLWRSAATRTLCTDGSLEETEAAVDAAVAGILVPR